MHAALLFGVLSKLLLLVDLALANRTDKSVEGFIDIGARLGAALDIAHVLIACASNKGSDLFLSDLALGNQV